MAIGHWNGQRWESNGWFNAAAGKTATACHKSAYTNGIFWAHFDPPR